MRRVRPSALSLLALAALVGLFHAAWSAYWAAGGSVMADSVGSWAIEWVREAPAAARTALWAIAFAKAAAAIVPVLSELGLVPPRRLWRGVGWVGGAVLVVYGAANTAAGDHGAKREGARDPGVTSRARAGTPRAPSSALLGGGAAVAPPARIRPPRSTEIRRRAVRNPWTRPDASPIGSYGVGVPCQMEVR